MLLLVLLLLKKRVDFMEKPCAECKTVTMIDDESKLCYNCWCELDILDHDKDEHVRE